MDPNDAGNWTGGRAGDGFLRGSNGGISAASYPTLDIAMLSRPEIEALRKSDYWDEVAGDLLPDPVAFMVADAAYMSGTSRAIRQMQAVLNVAIDGIIGKQTIDAAKAADAEWFVTEFAGARMLFLITLPNWPRERTGWVRRIMTAIPTALEDAQARA